MVHKNGKQYSFLHQNLLWGVYILNSTRGSPRGVESTLFHPIGASYINTTRWRPRNSLRELLVSACVFLPVFCKKKKKRENVISLQNLCINVTCQRQHYKEPLDEPKTVSNKYDLDELSQLDELRRQNLFCRLVGIQMSFCQYVKKPNWYA